MSGFGIVWDRSGVPLPQVDLSSAGDTGPGSRRLAENVLIVGADPGPRAGGPTHLYHGHLENRKEVRQALEREGVELPPRPSDRALAEAALDRWGLAALDRFYGPFAVVRIDPAPNGRPTLTCVRDPLGDQTLFWTREGDRVALATDLRLLLGLREVLGLRERGDLAPDWTALAHLFSFRPLPPDRSFFEGIRLVPPGERLRLTDRKVERTPFWSPPRPRLPREARDAVDELRSLLEQSVERALETPFDAPGRDPSILLSGGLDSSSVAVLAAELRRRGGATPPTAFSWVFDRLPSADRPFMEAVVADAGVQWRPIVCDGLGPFSDGPPRALLEVPSQDAYRRPLDETYRLAVEEGAPLLLTGHDGDSLFIDPGFWLRDSLRAGDLRPPLRSLGAALGSGDPIGSLRTLRGPFARLIRPIPGGATIRPWLTAFGRDRIAATPVDPRLEALGPASRRRGELLLDPFVALGRCVTRDDAARRGVDLRVPYRDLRLVEWSLAAPAHALSGPGVYKWGLRRALADLLPDVVTERRIPGTLFPLFQASVAAAWEELDAILRSPTALWPRLVDREWLLSRWRPELLEEGAGAAVGWLAICLEVWWRSVSSGACIEYHSSSIVPGSL